MNPRRAAAGLLLAALPLAACGNGSDLVLVTDLDPAAIAPIVADFEQIAQVKVTVREAPATGDVHLRDVATLHDTASSAAWAPLREASTAAVPTLFAAPDRTWVGVLGRVPVVAHRGAAAGQLPDDVRELPDVASRLGIAPGSTSFLSLVAGLAASDGEAAARDWLAELADAVTTFESPAAVAAAVAEGVVELGLTDHDIAAATSDVDVHYLRPGDVSSLLTVTAVAITADRTEDGTAFVDYVLSPEAQERLVRATGRHGLTAGAPAPPDVPTLADLQGGAGLPTADVADLEPARALVREAGLG